MIYITSDLHFGHDKESVYGPRGFKNVYESDKALISNWNETVSDEDDVYVLGDIMLNDDKNGRKCWNQLRGNKHIIIGNHDTETRIKILEECYNTEVIGHAYLLKWKDFNFYLTHYPTITGDLNSGRGINRDLINLCGHSHVRDRFADIDKGLIYHCDLDAHNNRPVAIAEIIEDIKRFCQDE